MKKNNLSQIKYAISLIFILLLIPILYTAAEERESEKIRILLGQSRSATSEPLTANLALPEDAIQLAKDEFIIADTNNGHIKRLKGGKLVVVAGDGEHFPRSNTVANDTPDKPFPALRLIRLGSDEWLSFSKRNGGINLHSSDKVKFVTNSYTLDGVNYTLNFPQFVVKSKKGIFVFDGAAGQKRFLKLQDNRLIPQKLLSTDISNIDLMGFDICGEGVVYSIKDTNGGVIFYRDLNGNTEELFRDRPYSNAIKCIGDDNFIYGARWELKQYKNGNITILSDKFVHISAIQNSLNTDTYVITDSDSEKVSLFNLKEQTNKVVISTDNAFLSETITKVQMLSDGETFLGMTPKGSIFSYNLSSGSFHRLIDPKKTASWNPLLRGHEFKSLRAFVFDEENEVIYLGSNHGIFRLKIEFVKLSHLCTFVAS